MALACCRGPGGATEVDGPGVVEEPTPTRDVGILSHEEERFQQRACAKSNRAARGTQRGALRWNNQDEVMRLQEGRLENEFARAVPPDTIVVALQRAMVPSPRVRKCSQPYH